MGKPPQRFTDADGQERGVVRGNKSYPSDHVLIEGTRKGYLRSADMLLRGCAYDLRNGGQLGPIAAEFIADLFESLAADQERLRALFGIAVRRGAPRRIAEHYELLGGLVRKHLDAGVPLKDGRPTRDWDGAGALTRAVEDCVSAGVPATESQAMRGYSRLCKKEKAREAHLRKVLGGVVFHSVEFKGPGHSRIKATYVMPPDVARPSRKRKPAGS